MRLTDKVTHTVMFYGFSGVFPYFQVVSGHTSLKFKESLIHSAVNEELELHF